MEKKIRKREEHFCEQCGKKTVMDVAYLCMIIGGKEVGRTLSEMNCPECDERMTKEAIERSGIKFIRSDEDGEGKVR